MKVDRLIWKAQMRAVEDAMEAWQEEHRAAEAVFGIEEIMRLQLSLLGATERMIRRNRAGLFTGAVTKPLTTGDALREICELTRQTLEKIHTIAADLRSEGYKVEGFDEHARAIEDLRRLEQEVVATWPRFDLEQLKRGMAQSERGEFVDAEGILRGLQDSNNS